MFMKPLLAESGRVFLESPADSAAGLSLFQAITSSRVAGGAHFRARKKANRSAGSMIQEPPASRRAGSSPVAIAILKDARSDGE